MRNLGVLRIADSNDFRASCADFLDIAVHFRRDFLLRHDRDDRRFRRDERERPVFQFAARIRFGVNIRNFFQLQRAFHRNRIIDIAPEIEDVMRFFQRTGVSFHRFSRVEHFVDMLRERLQFRRQMAHFVLGRRAFDLAHVERQHEKRDQLRRVRFRRRDRDFRPRQRINGVIGFARDGRTDGICDRDGERAETFRFLQCRERVNRFPRLAHHDDQRPLRRERMAVAILRRNLHRRRDFDETLDVVLCDEPRVIRRPARRDQHPVEFLQIRTRPLQIFKCDEPVLADVHIHRIANRFRLLVNFLEHEMRIAALFRRFRRPRHLLHLLGNGKTVRAQDLHPIRLYDRDFPIGQDINPPRARDNRRDIRRDEIFTLAQPDDERIVLLRADNRVRMLAIQEKKRVRPRDIRQKFPHRFQEIARIQLFHQMRNHLGIRFRLEDMTLGKQHLLDFHVIFDDTVVDNHEMIVAIPVRMRILIARPSVRRPARVPDADMPRKRRRQKCRLQIRQTAFFFHNPNAAFFIHRNPGRIISAILQAPKPVHQKMRRLSLAHIADNTAHTFLLISSPIEIISENSAKQKFLFDKYTSHIIPQRPQMV